MYDSNDYSERIHIISIETPSEENEGSSMTEIISVDDKVDKNE